MLPEPKDLPFRVGSSPFRIKGVAYAGTLKQYEALVPGGSAAVLSSFSEIDIGSFAQSGFFASSWYDIFPMAYMDYRAAKLMGKPFDDFALAAANLQAQSDMNGVYRLLLRFFSPASALKKLAVLSTIYFNFGKSSVQLETQTSAIVSTLGVPALLEDWFLRATAFYIGYCLNLTGATELKYNFLKSTPGDEREGHKTVNVRWRVTWQEHK